MLLGHRERMVSRAGGKLGECGVLRGQWGSQEEREWSSAAICLSWVLLTNVHRQPWLWVPLSFSVNALGLVASLNTNSGTTIYRNVPSLPPVSLSASHLALGSTYDEPRTIFVGIRRGSIREKASLLSLSSFSTYPAATVPTFLVLP